MIVTVENDSMRDQAALCQRLAYVLGLTKEMLEHADAGEWGKVADIEQRRREDLVACFADARPSGEPELVAQAMAALLHLNEQLMLMLKDARQEVMAQGQAFAHNRSATQSYQAVDASF